VSRYKTGDRGTRYAPRASQAKSQRERAAEVYVGAWFAGSFEPAKAVATALGVGHSTARTHVHRARLAGLIDVPDGHLARSVPWACGAWLACEACHVEWPCAAATEFVATRKAGPP
jgi:hypothetical protein